MTKDYLYNFENLFFNIEEGNDARKILERASEVLAAIIGKYGEIVNKFTLSKQCDFVDIVICLFICKILEQLDAIHILFSATSFDQAQIILRTLIENIISLEFILKEDTKKRAAAYFLEHHYKEIELGKKCFKENSEYAKKIIAIKGKDEFEKDRNKFKEKVKAFEHLIASNEVFRVIDEERKNKLDVKIKNRKKYNYIKWYEICSDIKNFYGLMKEIGYEKYYEGIYGSLSYETHALNSTMGLIIKESGVYLKLLRNPQGGSTLFSLTCTFSIDLLYKIYKYLNYGIEEKEEFKKFFSWFTNKRDAVCKDLDKIKIEII